MPREALSPLTNTVNSPRTPNRRLSAKFVSPATSLQTGLSSPGSVLTNFADEDEGQQRKQLRRKSQVFDLHRKNLANTGSPKNSPWSTDSLNGLTTAELADNYSDCIKLSAENKITAKNAFGLHLIDYMTVLLKKKELENFQVASSTLDASVKIYAGRVDFIHNHTYKVLSGLGGQKATAEDNEMEDGGDGEVQGVKKKKKTRRAHTTETNLKNINVDKFDLAFEVDPMFQMMSAAFDEGGAKGLLLNRLNFFEDSLHLVLDSSTPANLVEDGLQDSHESRKPIDVTSVQEMLSNLSLDKEICPSLSDFQFTDWNGESTDLFSNNLSEYAFDPNSEPQHLPTVDEEAEEIAHEDIEELDNAVDVENISNNAVDPVDTITGSNLGTAEFVESAFTDLSSGSVGKLRQILALEPSDYSYFNKILMGSWAGPTHWKTAAGSQVTRPTMTAKSTGQTKRSRKAPLRLTYNTDGKEMDKMFTHSKATSITKATWSKYSKRKTTLPDDQQMDGLDKLFKLFHNPNIMIKHESANSISRDDEIENYDYNNKNDMENFCPVDRDADDGIDNSSEGLDWSHEQFLSHASQQSSMSESGFNGTILTQDKLVAAPNKVQKIDIRYAKAAKRVDVKKLKSTMWSILSTDSLPDNTQVPLPLPETVPSTMSIPQTFSLLKDIIPANIPSSMAKNLTIQTVFACLLYLTNEKTLKLSSHDLMDDIKIQQDDTV